MNLKKTMETFVNEANRKIAEEKSLQKKLKKYLGKRIIINVRKRSDYLFRIRNNGVNLEIMKNVPVEPTDLYVSIEEKIIEKIIREKKLKLSYLPFIKYKNITIEELKLTKDLLREYFDSYTLK